MKLRKTMLGLAAAALLVPAVPAAAHREGAYSGKVWLDANGLRRKRPRWH